MGTNYGAGDGSTTFNLPDLRGRVAVGADAMGGVAAGRIGNILGAGIGSTAGEERHTLSTTEMPSHTHNNTLSDPGHDHGFPNGVNNSASGGAQSGTASGASYGSTGLRVVANTTGITINNASQGGGGTHNNIQPSIVCNYIMRIV